MGLEISFADMTLLARSLNLVEYGMGLVAEGLSTLLIPVKELKEDNAVQWHLEEKFRTSSNGKSRKLQASQILRHGEFMNWHRDLNSERLQGRRCFLGWAESAVVEVGATNLPTNVKYSGAQDCLSTGRPITYTLNGGTGGAGYVGFMAGMYILEVPAPWTQRPAIGIGEFHLEFLSYLDGVKLTLGSSRCKLCAFVFTIPPASGKFSGPG